VCGAFDQRVSVCSRRLWCYGINTHACVVRRYKYRMCPFDEATQEQRTGGSRTTLGYVAGSGTVESSNMLGVGQALGSLGGEPHGDAL
jgi:hypothetical protein